MSWAPEPAERAKLAGVELEDHREYDPTIIRKLAMILDPQYIRHQGIESLEVALGNRSQTLEERIPNSHAKSFLLILDFYGPRLTFKYMPSKGYFYWNEHSSEPK